ncbi:hypothetical protein [Yersinia pseudotuberculosis]|uniref:hypothetical protein n=1 Tax=Yersinia pseudotuberculosis TaxID=633 RepID=UPI0005DAFA8D|nr:hypothetical protein [Yersinia pseudotuberculosis]CND44610.1 Uncharacterised protein [Yersinia pseudotuberculosis]
MFIPVYQLDSFKTEQEALQSAEMTSEDLKHSMAAIVVSGDAAQNSMAKMITGDGTVVFVYDADGRVSVWFSNDYWEYPELDDAKELIESVEGGIPAEYWAIFETVDDKNLGDAFH